MIELLLDAEGSLALGLLDRAERTYRSVLEVDPHNGIAAVGLARVALERGDEAGARALAQAALDIDPDNATARRMVDRLDEVARYRAGPADPAPPPAARADPAVAIAPPTAEPPPAAPPAARADPAVAIAPPTDAEADPAATPAAPPGDAPAAPPGAASSTTASPARPGLLRRILRRS